MYGSQRKRDDAVLEPKTYYDLCGTGKGSGRPDSLVLSQLRVQHRMGWHLFPGRSEVGGKKDLSCT